MFNLPEVKRYHLARAPLARALAQVRFPLVAHLQTLEGIAPLQDRLRELFPYMQRQDVKELSVVIGAEGPATPEVGTSMSWELTDDAGSLLSVSPGTATLSVGEEYLGVEDFSSKFQTVLDVLSAVEGLRRCDRLGVRYVNLAELPPGDEPAWTRWFRPELTGWTATGVVSTETRLVGTVSQTHLSAPPSAGLSDAAGEVQALLRHGFVRAGSVVPGIPQGQVERDAYVLDFDLFIPVPQSFDPASLSRQFLALHSQIDRFFRWTLTDDGAGHFELQEVE